MVLRIDLGELPRLRDVREVAGEADRLRVGLDHLARGGVLGVFREGPVAGLAADAGVLASLEGVALFRVTLDAGGPARKARRAHAVVRKGAGAVVAVNAESLRNEHGLQDQAEDHARREERRHAEQMLLVLQEPIHDRETMGPWRPSANDSDDLFSRLAIDLPDLQVEQNREQ